MKQCFQSYCALKFVKMLQITYFWTLSGPFRAKFYESDGPPICRLYPWILCRIYAQEHPMVLCDFDRLLFRGKIFFSSGFSASFTPHFPNYHKYHLYSSIKKVIFRPIFTNKNAIFTFRFFSKKSEWKIDDFYIVHIKCIHLRQTCLTRNPSPQKIAPIQNLPNTSKIVEQPHA